MKYTPHPVAAFQHFGLLVMIMTPLVMAACSGGGGSSGISGSASVRALSLPDRIELTDMKSRSAADRVPLAAGIFRAACDDAGSDSSPAARHTGVDGTDALDMVNDILGFVRDTGYADFVNQGAYMAVVLQVGESRQIQSGSSAISTTAEQLMRIYVEVTRDSNSSPMIVRVWMEDKEGTGGGPMRIRGYFSVTRGASATYPYGVMFAHFKAAVLDCEGNEGADAFTMAVSVGIDGGHLVMENPGRGKEEDPHGSQSRERIVANIDRTEGNAYVQEGLN